MKKKSRTLFSGLTAVIIAIVIAIFCRLFLVSLYRIQTNALAPEIISGDMIVANQLAYGLKLPWMDHGYFMSEPQIGDVVVFKLNLKMGDEQSIQKIVQKTDENHYVLAAEGVLAPKTVARDQILSKVWLVWFSVGATQDSISEKKSVRWNRFLTFIN